MKGEFDSAQRETTDAYRENWERLFGCNLAAYRAQYEAEEKVYGPMYPNGCPILDEDQRANQADRETA